MKKDKKILNIIRTIFLCGYTPVLATKMGKAIKTNNVEKTTDGTAENTVGYENIKLRYNTEVHNNNFVILHVSADKFNDITALREKLGKCDELGISVGLVLDTKACDLAQIYKDVDYLQAIVKDHKIDMPVYLNIDGIMENKTLNNAQKTAIIDAFTQKALRSDMYVGFYGKDCNLVDCNQYIYNLKAYDTFLVQDSEEIVYDGTCQVIKDLEGNITAKVDLSSIINKKGLNSSNKLVYSSSYTVQEGDTYHSLGLQFGLSEADLISYNNGNKNLIVGETILVPNLYKTVNTENKTISYSYAVARGIDISNYQSKIDWDRVAETSDYVIVQVARDKSDYSTHNGAFKQECINQISNVVDKELGLGLYFCISKDMKVSVYEERLERYLNELDSRLSAEGITLEREDVPVFLDFEVYYQYNDYYRLMESFERICNNHGFTRIGIYGNQSTLNAISNSMKKDNESIELGETNWYVWKSGGPQYSARENTHDDDVTLDELKEIEAKAGDGYLPVMQQVTNVCIDTGAVDGRGHCDVSYLYDYSVFGDSIKPLPLYDVENTIEGTVEIDLNNYTNIPVQKVATCAEAILSATYIVCFIKILGDKLIIKLKNKSDKTVKKLVK